MQNGRRGAQPRHGAASHRAPRRRPRTFLPRLRSATDPFGLRSQVAAPKALPALCLWPLICQVHWCLATSSRQRDAAGEASAFDRYAPFGVGPALSTCVPLGRPSLYRAGRSAPLAFDASDLVVDVTGAAVRVSKATAFGAFDTGNHTVRRVCSPPTRRSNRGYLLAILLAASWLALGLRPVAGRHQGHRGARQVGSPGSRATPRDTARHRATSRDIAPRLGDVRPVAVTSRLCHRCRGNTDAPSARRRCRDAVPIENAIPIAMTTGGAVSSPMIVKSNSPGLDLVMTARAGLGAIVVPVGICPALSSATTEKIDWSSSW